MDELLRASLVWWVDAVERTRARLAADGSVLPRRHRPSRSRASSRQRSRSRPGHATTEWYVVTYEFTLDGVSHRGVDTVFPSVAGLWHAGDAIEVLVIPERLSAPCAGAAGGGALGHDLARTSRREEVCAVKCAS